jgi:tetratricopeptide (TPR) repeat protein
MSPSEEDLSEARNSHCVACLEPLRAGARRCPHCQAPQRPQRWQVIGEALKWIGGVTALLSLFLLAQQVNNVVSTWTDRQESVTALIMASDLQASAGDYAGAWGLLDQALALEPGSTQVQAHRVDLAMLWVRNIAITGDQTFSEIVNPLLPSLYLGAVRSSSSERADALAHIGWSNALRTRDGVRQLAIDEQFDAALVADPDNVFAHTWQATWLFMRANDIDYDKPKIDLARAHFGAALAIGQRRQWIRSMQLSSYLGSNNIAAQIEAIAVVASLKAEGSTLAAHNATFFERELTNLVIGRGNRADVLRDAALNRFTWKEILDVYAWAISMRPDPNYDPQERYALARLTELAGKPANALTMYRSLLAEASEGYTFSQELVDTVARLDGAVNSD